MTHKKSDGSYIYEDALTVAEAIKVIESCDESTKELSQNDSLAQVLGKEHPGRVREEYKREIVELRAETAEEKKKTQSLEEIVRYLVQ
ncbi:hypothetical protein PIB30_032058 [Stylosanthes scabra]|uniref:Uncharacterized protein n=1 Tax=Stylosanthes scabra TaxID=79078 RepID=A0ABU6QBK9_9FABA|nr:hypothetical protein [Stylosanthes scabra]